MKKVALLLAGLVVVGICLVLVFAGGSGDEYDTCVSDCVDTARDANIDRLDITSGEYQAIMAVFKKGICPDTCERYK